MLVKADIRTELSLKNESLGKKIRSVKVQKIPFTIVIGDSEVSGKMVTLESREKGKLGEYSTEKLLDFLQTEIAARR